MCALRAFPQDLTTDDSAGPGRRDPTRERASPARLVVLFDAAEPQRVGEVFLLDGQGPFILGRGDEAERPVRQVPGHNSERERWHNLRLSRAQCEVRRLSDTRLAVENRSKQGMYKDGSALAQTLLAPGDMVQLGDQVLLGCVRRPETLPACNFWPDAAQPLGQPDGTGIVGESAAAWALRERLAFVAHRSEHALILGPSGSGKELVAQALHALSSRREGPCLATNVATMPEALIDAELFGVEADYPNAGSPARAGLIPQAEGGTLFLDEISEIPESMQAHLLRFMDAGEYRRLGEATVRRADLRVVAATNRNPSALKDDLRARFVHQIEVPALRERWEDVPVLAQFLLKRMLSSDAALRQRFGDEQGIARVHPDLIRALCQHPLPLQMRQLQALLWKSVADSPEGILLCPADMPTPAAPAVDPSSLTKAQVMQALSQVNGSHAEVAAHLGLANRYALRRLLKKFGLQ